MKANLALGHPLNKRICRFEHRLYLPGKSVKASQIQFSQASQQLLNPSVSPERWNAKCTFIALKSRTRTNSHATKTELADSNSNSFVLSSSGFKLWTAVFLFHIVSKPYFKLAALNCLCSLPTVHVANLVAFNRNRSGWFRHRLDSVKPTATNYGWLGRSKTLLCFRPNPFSRLWPLISIFSSQGLREGITQLLHPQANVAVFVQQTKNKL